MFRSLRTTVEYTISCFKYQSFQRVKENHGSGWVPKVLRAADCLLVIEGKRHHKVALELGKTWCYVEFINPLIFPAYIRLNGRPYMLKKRESLYHKQSGRLVVISRLENTKEQNYYITVRLD